MTLLDIGGGFLTENFIETAVYINQALEEHFPEVIIYLIMYMLMMILHNFARGYA